MIKQRISNPSLRTSNRVFIDGRCWLLARWPRLLPLKKLKEIADLISQDSATSSEDLLELVNTWFNDLGRVDYSLGATGRINLDAYCHYLDASDFENENRFLPNAFDYRTLRNYHDVFKKIQSDFLDSFGDNPRLASVNERRKMNFGANCEIVKRKSYYRRGLHTWYYFASKTADECLLEYDKLARFFRLRPNFDEMVKNVRYRSWKRLLHSRLSNCLVAKREQVAAAIRPAFLAYKWDRAYVDKRNDIRSRSRNTPTSVEIAECIEQRYSSSPLLQSALLEPSSFKVIPVNDSYGHTRAHVAITNVARSAWVFIFFTGTNRFSVWFTNLSLRSVRKTYFEGTDLEVTVRVHSGILRMFNTLWDTIKGKLNEFNCSLGMLNIGGHSLGGALSHLCCLQLIEWNYMRYRGLSGRNVSHGDLHFSVSTFACPSVFLFPDNNLEQFKQSFSMASGVDDFYEGIVNFNNKSDPVVHRSRR